MVGGGGWGGVAVVTAVGLGGPLGIGWWLGLLGSGFNVGVTSAVVVGGTLVGGELAFTLGAGGGCQDVRELVDTTGVGLELGGGGESCLQAHGAQEALSRCCIVSL